MCIQNKIHIKMVDVTPVARRLRQMTAFKESAKGFLWFPSLPPFQTGFLFGHQTAV